MIEIIVQSLDYVCHVKWKLGPDKLYLGQFHDTISRHPMPIIAALASQLAEIGVRTTFFVLTSVATLLFEELDGRLEELASQSNAESNVQEISRHVRKWQMDYDLVVQLTEQINSVFGFILLVTCAIDFAVPIIEFSNVRFHQGTTLKFNLQCVHLILRFLLLLIASHRLESKVAL